MSRERLPNRRPSETFTLELHGLHYIASFSCFDDGRVAEFFLQSQKPASQKRIRIPGTVRSASLPLQYGCPLDLLRRTLLRDEQGRASTPLGHCARVIVGSEATR